MLQDPEGHGDGTRPARRARGAWRFLATALLLAGCGRPGAPPEVAGPRVVSLAPNLTEIIFAIGAGDRLVGRSSACDYPPEAARVPVVGGFGRPSVEGVLAAGPTLVVDVDLEDRALRGIFRRHGVAAHSIACRRLADVPDAIRRLGGLLDRSEAAEALAESIEADLARLRAEAAATPMEARPRLFIELWPDPLMTVGRASFVHDLVELAGARNLAAEADRDYFSVDPEWVIARDPDAILVLHRSAGDEPAQRIAARPGWSGVRAARAGRVIADVDPDLLQRPGPRLAEGAAQLRARLRAWEAAP